MATDTSYERLRTAIVAGDLEPNERLVEADLTGRLGVGRTSVRSALIRLESEGLVEREPNRGARVRRVSEAEALEILDARGALEGLAARRAAERATPADAEALRAILGQMRERREAGDLPGASAENARLHARLLELSGHRTAQRLIAGLSSQTVRFQFRTILVPGRAAASFAEHTAIVDAVASGDPDAAERAMRTHLDHVAAALRATARTT